jgi:hypothetical protein
LRPDYQLLHLPARKHGFCHCQDLDHQLPALIYPVGMRA